MEYYNLFKSMKRLIVIFVLISFFNCSNDDDIIKPTVSELLVGKWQLLGSRNFGGNVVCDTGIFNTDFEFGETPTETTIIEIILEETEFDHWELGSVTSDITINVVSGDLYIARLYQWIEFESVFEDFDTQASRRKEYIALLTKDRFVWASCGFPGIKRDFIRVQ